MRTDKRVTEERVDPREFHTINKSYIGHWVAPTNSQKQSTNSLIIFREKCNDICVPSLSPLQAVAGTTSIWLRLGRLEEFRKSARIELA